MVTTFRLFTEGQESFYSIEEHHRPNIQILRAFPLAFCYGLFQTQMKSRTRKHAVMQSFALTFWEKEAPEEVSRTEELSNKIELSLLLVLCHFMPEDFPPIQTYKELSPGPPRSLWKSSHSLTVVLEGGSISWMLTERPSPQQD